MTRLLRLCIVLLMFIGAPLIIHTVKAQPSGAQIQISDFDVQAFPNIRFSFRPLNADGSVIEGLVDASIVLEENGARVLSQRLTPAWDVPQLLVFVIDTGYAASQLNDEVNNILEHAANSLRAGT